jgi:putative transposase
MRNVVLVKYPNHIWMADLTEIRSFLGLIRLKLAAVIDVFSRMPLAYAVFLSEPSAEQMLDVLDQAMRVHGRPRHFVSDQGSQFTAGILKETLEALSIRQRFGAIGQYGSIAIMERFWRTLKLLLDIKLFPPLSKPQLETRVELALAYYAVYRPHQGLDGATPAEVYLNLEPAAHRAVRPPRMHQRDPTAVEGFPFEVVYLDPERRLPILIRTDQAA